MEKAQLAKKLHTLALVCEASYRDGCAGLPDGMQVVRTITAGSDVAYVVDSTDPVCPGRILVFRGSDDAQDWATNFALDLVEYPGINLKFHRGFLDAVLRLAIADDGYLRLTNFDLITGHSRGGALAVIHQVCVALVSRWSFLVRLGRLGVVPSPIYTITW